jgi:mono/diheme cytochrome c family protein
MNAASFMRFGLAVAIGGLINGQIAGADTTAEVQTIFEESCLRCHGAKKPNSGFRLDNRADALRGGDIGISIIPGKADESPLIRSVTHAESDLEMPPVGKGDRLSDHQVGILKTWINEGAEWTPSTTDIQIRYSATPTIRKYWVTGNQQRFREHTGARDGVTGGAAEFALSQQVDPDTTFAIAGHALAGDDDYRVELKWERNDFGWARMGAEHWMRYYDNTGGVQPGIALPARLGFSPELGLGHAWIEFGFELSPDTEAVLGYDYRYQDGAKSMLNWGLSSGIGIAPAYQLINDDVHRLRFDLRHDWSDTLITDEFQLEFHALNNTQVMTGDVLNAVGSTYSANSRTDQYVGANTFRLERQIRDWWHAAGAYHYSQLRADNALSVTSSGTGAVFPEPRWQANSILNKSETHAFSLSSLFGPWNDLTISPTFQSEWNRRRSAGGADMGYIFGGAVTAVPIALDASRDERITTEALTLRYTGIPAVVVSADARLRQEAQGIFEQQIGGDAGLDPFATKNPSFLQRTDGDAAEQNYLVGLRWSPQPGWAVSTRLRHREKETGYRNELLVLSGAGGPSSFPGFIRWWEQETDEIQSRITARLRRWWRLNLTYQFTRGDYTLATDAATGNPGGGGEIHASNSDFHTISLGSTFTPNHRWHISGNVSLTDSRTASAQNGVAGITTWQGTTVGTYAHVGFAWNERTDLVGTYSFSLADFGQPTTAGRVVQGTDYALHGLRAGLHRRLRRNAELALEYGFHRYDEPTAAGQNDYTAHGVFASLSLPWTEKRSDNSTAR